MLHLFPLRAFSALCGARLLECADVFLKIIGVRKRVKIPLCQAEKPIEPFFQEGDAVLDMLKGQGLERLDVAMQPIRAQQQGREGRQ